MAEFKAMEKKIKELEAANDILKDYAYVPHKKRLIAQSLFITSSHLIPFQA